ncbi:diguanylate cyclase (GGDEF)-like protein [Planomicrobium soli]|uniref:Diguanylate cyclase (GGDEF)-like protein n=1 Tax=Planomicrobium soli TaxID=1176648 RepID=A0A2P8H1Z3_9BACL|nr:EAL domain-containing protein [Planomicrobium soli]PSL40231.1 diguanylate cyclase (GGDEF)-like protein [Planomicrobium soli]
MIQENEQIQEWMNTIDEFLIVVDGNGTIVRVNQSWIDFCMENNVGEPMWKTGHNYFDQLRDCEKHNEIQAIQSVINCDLSEHKQLYPLLLKNGETQWLSVKVRAIKLLSTGTCGAIIYQKPVSLHDIEPLTAESILESMTDGFVLLNDQFQFYYVNEIAEVMFRIKRESIVGIGLFDAFPEAVGTPFHQTYEKAMKEQITIEFMDYYEPLNTWLQVKVCPLKNGGLALYFQDVSKLKKIEAKLSDSVNYDYLTGLPNRRHLSIKANSFIAQTKKFSIFYLNIDNLKLVNAVYNHDAGDTMLKNIAEKLKVLTSNKCEVVRLDGNEFAIMYEPEIGERLAYFAETIIEIFKQPFTLNNFHTISINVSIGISCFPFDAQQFSEVISYAETAMQEAKKIRGSSYVFFRPAMHNIRSRKALIEESLERNLTSGGLYYCLQPQINGNSGEIVGVEVLARWNHPELGEISPLEFIEVAEETGAIVPLTLYLTESMFAQLKEWKIRFGRSLPVAINMTPSLLANPKFFDSFFELIEKYEIQPQLIEIEITEQAELTYSHGILENLLLCKSKGVSIAIDDFGTGFSMISYLTHFPITTIKIDKSFIQKIGQDKKSEAVLKSLIHLAKSIECDLVAEGVERLEEVEFLKSNDCIIYQGYLYDKPLKVHDFEMKYLLRNYRFA